MNNRFRTLACTLLLWSGAGLALEPGDGRLLATGGLLQIEGSAGGGIVPWAVIAGYGEKGEHAPAAALTRVSTADYRLDAAAVAWGFDNRLELSINRGRFDLGTLGRALGLDDAALSMTTAGAKLRVIGDLFYGDLPQVSVGVQHKRLHDFGIPQSVGARSDNGTDFYVSASRLFLAGAGGYNLLLNGTARWTRANQTGYLGFGGDRGNSHELVFEGSAAILLNRGLAIGVDYRQKPDNLAFAREDDWADFFIAWFPNKHVSATAAWADLGDIAGLRDQTGPYLNLQVSF